MPLLRWWDAYPKVQSSPELMSPEELAALVGGAGETGEFVAVDVRRDDYKVCLFLFLTPTSVLPTNLL